jgi:hypothetical protein
LPVSIPVDIEASKFESCPAVFSSWISALRVRSYCVASAVLIRVRN